MSPVIKVENLSKRYRLGVVNRDMLYKDLQSRWAKFRGKEDPNAPIGLKHDKRLEHGDEFWALRNVDLEIKEGEILGIIGRNGAGKSTLLKILSQITAPTEGGIKVKGRIASLLEVGTGFHPELTGRENVYLNGAILGMTRKEVTSKFDEIVAFSGISEFIDTPVKRYSSGMYVRLAFAVAAHLEPEILIVDEVLAVGDAAFQKQCLGKMKEVSRRQGRTVLFVSHNMASIRQLCSRAVCLDDGQVAGDGRCDEIVESYLSSAMSFRKTSHTVLSPDGNLSVKLARIVNQRGEDTISFSPGDTLTLEIQIAAREPIKQPYFWVAISHGDQSQFSANSMLDGFRPLIVHRKQMLRLTFESLLLNPPHSYSIVIGARHDDAVRELLPPAVIGAFLVVGSAEDCGLDAPVAERWLAYSPGVTLPYKWELESGGCKSVNVKRALAANSQFKS
jgi:lipopolysaccharide transport system ATP-binding protein